MVRGGSCHPSWGPQHWEGLRHSVMGRNAMHGEVQVTRPAWPCPGWHGARGCGSSLPQERWGDKQWLRSAVSGRSWVCPLLWHHCPVVAVYGCAARPLPMW